MEQPESFQPAGESNIEPASTEPQRETLTLQWRPPAKKVWLTYSLIGISIFIYLLQIFSQFSLGIDIPAMLGKKANEMILIGEVWRLVTPVLLHGSIMHLGFNMYALYVLGPGLERHYGHLRFFLLYLLGAFAGNVVSFFLSPKPSLGASTAIFGLVAAEGIFIYNNRFLFGRSAGRMLTSVLTVVVINLVLGMSPGIDNWGHLGGLMGGLFYAWFAGPHLQVSREIAGYTLIDRNDEMRALQVFFAGIVFFIVLAFIKFYL